MTVVVWGGIFGRAYRLMNQPGKAVARLREKAIVRGQKDGGRFYYQPRDRSEEKPAISRARMRPLAMSQKAAAQRTRRCR